MPKNIDKALLALATLADRIYTHGNPGSQLITCTLFFGEEGSNEEQHLTLCIPASLVGTEFMENF